MAMIGRFLNWLGRHGPALMILSLVAGISLGPAAEAARYALPASAFLLTLGSFLTASLSPCERVISVRVVVLCLVWTGLAVPVLAVVAMHAFDLPPALAIGVLLAALAPPTGSAAAIAALLGLRPRLALTASVGLALISPLSMPALTAILGTGLNADTDALALRLTGIIAAAGGIALLARIFRRQTAPLLPDATAAAGVAVIGLMIVGVTTASNIAADWLRDPEHVEAFLAAAFCANIVSCMLGAAIFAPLGLRTALTIGLLSGNRNVTLAWAAAGATLAPMSQTYVAASVVPILVLPLVLKLLLRLRAQVCKPRVVERALRQ